VTGWLVPSTGQKIAVQPGWYLPPQKTPLAENRFLHAGKGQAVLYVCGYLVSSVGQIYQFQKIGQRGPNSNFQQIYEPGEGT